MKNALFFGVALLIGTGCFAQVNSGAQGADALGEPYIIKPGTIAEYFRTSGLQKHPPLFVVNGVKMEVAKSNDFHGISREVADLKVSEMETITVLKDTDAIASYGADGANGVILITTKGVKPLGDK